MSEKIDYFMHLDMPVYGKVGLLEGKGIHYFNAMIKAKGDMSSFMKFLVLELLIINDKQVDEKFLNEMPLKDVSYLMTVIGTMLE